MSRLASLRQDLHAIRRFARRLDSTRPSARRRGLSDILSFVSRPSGSLAFRALAGADGRLAEDRQEGLRDRVRDRERRPQRAADRMRPPGEAQVEAAKAEGGGRRRTSPSAMPPFHPISPPHSTATIGPGRVRVARQVGAPCRHPDPVGGKNDGAARRAAAGGTYGSCGRRAGAVAARSPAAITKATIHPRSTHIPAN